MYNSRQSSPQREALVPPSEPDMDQDSDTASTAPPENRRKRPRSEKERENREHREGPSTPACHQCRLRKVRCDRRQPECSNCRKAGIECNSSNTLKRVNHMKQLRDDFTDVVKQLGDVDQTLSMLTDLVRQLSTARSSSDPENTSQGVAVFSPSPSGGLSQLLQNTAQNDGQALPGESPMMPEPICETVELNQYGERLYRYPAPMVLMESLFYQTNDLLISEDENGVLESDRPHSSHGLQSPTLRATVQQRLDDYPCNPRWAEVAAASDIGPVTTPPRLMANLFIDGYLRNFNARTPIFKEDELHRAIDAHYSDEQLHDGRAWALIVNNIVLLELGLEIQTARASHSTSRVTNDEILPSFLKNCDRAIGNLDVFMTPSLVNLQALMTLTLAAQEFYDSATTERVCHAACQVGRIMGIHRSRERGQVGDDAAIAAASEAERDRLFRILYTMDKQRVFMTGQPCDLYMFDSNRVIGPGGIQRAHGPRGVSDAFDHLMTIWEEIYLKLLTPRAIAAGPDAQSRQMRLVASSLDEFARRYGELLSPRDEKQAGDTDLFRIELLYGYQVSQILVLHGDQGNQASSNKILDLARSSLGLIIELCTQPLTTARFALLARIFRRYPMVPFVELLSYRLKTLSSQGVLGSSALDDVALLRIVSDQLATMQYDNLTHIFYARLHSGLVWALDTLEAIAEILARPLPQQPRQPTAPMRNPRSTPSSSSAATSDLSPEAYALLPSRAGNQPYSSRLKAPRTDEDEFSGGGSGGPGRQAQLTNFGLYTPGTDGDMMSRPLSPIGQPGASSYFATVHHQQEPQLDMAGGQLNAGNTNWADFNLDFFPGAFAQGVRWE